MRSRINPILAVCFLALLHAVAAVAQDRPGIIGPDDRVPVTERGAPWDAVGHVNISRFSQTWICTGSLVAPTLVLTAAHCLADPASQSPFPLGNIHYVAGVRGSENKGDATARCLRFLDGYVDARPSDRKTQGLPRVAFAKDVAAIVLKERVPVTPIRLADNTTARPGLALVHAAYPRDRRFQLSAHFDCRLLAVEGPFWINDCDTVPGSSGGPVFVKVDGGLALSAIMVGGVPQQHNLAVPITQWTSLVRDADCP